MSYDPREQDELLGIFREMLKAPTGDGGAKRLAGSKPSWKVDPSHRKAIFSHLGKWVAGELIDKDSGAHPLVHVAWRCLAQAWQETRYRDLPQYDGSRWKAVCMCPFGESPMHPIHHVEEMREERSE